ncbi:MAG: condensation domain-containing protein [Velocimicrobium sp.]
MKYKAEIFDNLQYLYEETKFNDHQLHCVIKFENKLNADIMKQAIKLLLKVVPLLSCVYNHNNGNSYWETSIHSEFNDIFTIVSNEADFNTFTTSKTNERTGPQIKACLYRFDEDSLSIVMNHMVCDAAGFKQCLYLLSNLYTNLMKNPSFSPEYIMNGDRSIQKITSQISFSNKVKAFLFQNKESNQKNNDKFSMSQEGNTTPFILTHEISAKRFARLHDYCKNNNVTINDVVLTSYYRVLAKMMNMKGKPLSIPIMIDMRRYLKEQSSNSLDNLSSTVITTITVEPKESFKETLTKVNKEMNEKKAKQMGMNGFVKLALINRIFNNARSYSITKRNLKNPYICMTNIGILDSKKLVFEGSPIKNAFMCGSIKYRPHFQMALSSFADQITFSSNLYGTMQDRNTILYFFNLLEQELPQ